MPITINALQMPSPRACPLSRVCVADAWTGETIAKWLGRLIAVMGRPAAYLKDGGGDLHKAVAFLGDQGLRSPCIDDISHAVAGMLKRFSTITRHSRPLCRPVVASRANSRHDSGVFGAPESTHQSPIYACPSLVHLGRSGAQALASRGRQDRLDLRQVAGVSGSIARVQSRIKRFRGEASSLLACQKILKTTGLSHDTEPGASR